MHRDRLRVALFEDAMRNERQGFEIAIYSLEQSRNGGFIMRHRVGLSGRIYHPKRAARLGTPAYCSRF